MGLLISELLLSLNFLLPKFRTEQALIHENAGYINDTVTERTVPQGFPTDDFISREIFLLEMIR